MFAFQNHGDERIFYVFPRAFVFNGAVKPLYLTPNLTFSLFANRFVNIYFYMGRYRDINDRFFFFAIPVAVATGENRYRERKHKDRYQIN